MVKEVSSEAMGRKNQPKALTGSAGRDHPPAEKSFYDQRLGDARPAYCSNAGSVVDRAGNNVRMISATNNA